MTKEPLLFLIFATIESKINQVLYVATLHVVGNLYIVAETELKIFLAARFTNQIVFASLLWGKNTNEVLLNGRIMTTKPNYPLILFLMHLIVSPVSLTYLSSPSFFFLLCTESTGGIDLRFEAVSFGRVSISKQQ
mmetsp:Transcript_13939/g.32447  ORF Transcript_13939/g.32447 Transcript_13939/m.32447 type:complete len:135 (+) Transcript_13939:2020-2424(+)